jgi:hypothetical protein
MARFCRLLFFYLCFALPTFSTFWSLLCWSDNGSYYHIREISPVPLSLVEKNQREERKGVIDLCKKDDAVSHGRKEYHKG